MPHFDGHINYDRVVPDRFSEERDDRLMNSLISNYALEVRDVNGQPTGHFFLNKEQAKLAADGKWDELKELQDRLDGGIEK